MIDLVIARDRAAALRWAHDYSRPGKWLYPETADELRQWFRPDEVTITLIPGWEAHPAADLVDQLIDREHSKPLGATPKTKDTTARRLAAHYQQLLSEGVPRDLADDIVRDAARADDRPLSVDLDILDRAKAVTTP